MKSLLGVGLAVLAAAAYGLAYWLSVRPGAAWLDGQWLFLVALPYNWTLLHVFGATDFSPDSPSEIAAAWLFDAVLAFLAGALVETILRRLWRLTFGSRRRA
jgi:hypothetical protein